MSLAIVATLFAKEPVDRRTLAEVTGQVSLLSPRGLFDAIVGPFLTFLKTHGSVAILMLAAISLYRLPDFVMGPMVGPFYTDLGLTKEAIGAMRLSVGLVAAFVGIAAGGLFAVRFGFGKTLLMGALIGPMSNLGYTLMAVVGLSTPVFGGVLFVENFSRRLRRCRARRLHGQPDQHRLHGDAVRPAQLLLCPARQIPEGLLGRGGRKSCSRGDR